MPVTETISGETCRIHSWKITESTAELEEACRAAGIVPLNNFVLEDRYKQHMATLLLFDGLFAGETLQYASTGKPYVKEGTYVSISHSGDTVVMMRSGTECGVDIECIHPRVEKVKHKFLDDEELLRVQGANIETMTQYWTAKEAMFKVYGSQEVFMRNNIFVRDVTAQHAKAELRDGTIVLKRNIRFHVLGDMMLAWTEPTHEN